MDKILLNQVMHKVYQIFNYSFANQAFKKTFQHRATILEMCQSSGSEKFVMLPTYNNIFTSHLGSTDQQ